MWLKPTALWAYKHARWKPCCCGIFCSRFHPILSPLKIILEMVFWTNLMLDLICTWLEKTRRFCRQVNKKISSCFWTASTCVQRSSLGWCSRLTYMETVDWIHVEHRSLPRVPAPVGLVTIIGTRGGSKYYSYISVDCFLFAPPPSLTPTLFRSFHPTKDVMSGGTIGSKMHENSLPLDLHGKKFEQISRIFDPIWPIFAKIKVNLVSTMY